MSWWEFTPHVALAVAVTFVPGVALGLCLGLRRTWLVALAPGISVGLFGVWTIVLGEVGVVWNLLTAAGVTAVTALVVLAVRAVLTAPAGPPARHGRSLVDRAPPAWSLALGTLVVLVSTLLVFDAGASGPEMPPQTWDAVFHLNALRGIVDGGSASSLTLGTVADQVHDVVVYPSGWHALTSLAVVDSVVVAANAVSIVTAGIIWPLGLGLLGSQMAPGRPWMPVLVAVPGAAFVAFPARMLTYGTLWPNAFAFALIPAVLAVVLALCRRRGAAPGGRGLPSVGLPSVAQTPAMQTPPMRAPLVLGLLGVVAGCGFAHPNAVLAAAVLAAPIVVGWWIRSLRDLFRGSAPARWLWLVLPLVALAGVSTVVLESKTLRTATNFSRHPVEEPYGALVGLLTDSQLALLGYGNSTMSFVLLGLAVAGLATICFTRRNVWVLVSVALATGLYALSLNTAHSLAGLAGAWYTDPVRLGGLAAISAVPLVGLGLAGVADVLERVTTRLVGPRRGVGAGLAVVVVAGLVVSTGGLRFEDRVERYEADYSTPDSPTWFGLITPEELELQNRLGDELGPDAVVLGNPFSGSPLLYAVAGIPVVYEHLKGIWAGDAVYVAGNLRDAASDPQVCEALDRLGVTHLYVDEVLYWPSHNEQLKYQGLWAMPPDGLDVELVDRAGEVRVFEITGCG